MPLCKCFLSVVFVLVVAGIASSLCLGVAPGGTWCKALGVAGWRILGGCGYVAGDVLCLDGHWLCCRRGCVRESSGVALPMSAFVA